KDGESHHVPLLRHCRHPTDPPSASRPPATTTAWPTSSPRHVRHHRLRRRAERHLSVKNRQRRPGPVAETVVLCRELAGRTTSTGRVSARRGARSQQVELTT